MIQYEGFQYEGFPTKGQSLVFDSFWIYSLPCSESSDIKIWLISGGSFEATYGNEQQIPTLFFAGV